MRKKFSLSVKNFSPPLKLYFSIFFELNVKNISLLTQFYSYFVGNVFFT